jgi:hypothetical protein
VEESRNINTSAQQHSNDFAGICHYLTNFLDHLIVKLRLPEFGSMLESVSDGGLPFKLCCVVRLEVTVTASGISHEAHCTADTCCGRGCGGINNTAIAIEQDRPGSRGNRDDADSRNAREN